MSSIDPNTARTAEDFVLMLRHARSMSELTFWELEERARAAGYDLEPTVLAETLGLADLPDEKLVISLLHACGYTEQEIGQWLDVHARLADDTPLSDLSAAETAVIPVQRPRHNLRVPGKGSRRAGGQQLRVLLLAAAAAVIAVASIAVIVAAVDNDEITAHPPAATGSSTPETGPTGTPAPEASAVPSQTPSASPTPSASATPSPAASPSVPTPQSTLRSGTATLQTGQSIDLDDGGAGLLVIGADLTVTGEGDGIRDDPSNRPFALVTTATKQACTATNEYQKTLQNLAAGNGVCVRTDRGSHAHLSITRVAPLSFSYVVFS